MGTSSQKHLSHSSFTTEACQLTKQQQWWACLLPHNSTFHTHLSPWKLASIHLVSRAFLCLVLGQYNNISSLPQNWNLTSKQPQKINLKFRSSRNLLGRGKMYVVISASKKHRLAKQVGTSPGPKLTLLYEHAQLILLHEPYQIIIHHIYHASVCSVEIQAFVL